MNHCSDFILLRNSHAEKYYLVLLIEFFLVLPGYFKAFIGDDVDKANSTLRVFSTLTLQSAFMFMISFYVN